MGSAELEAFLTHHHSMGKKVFNAEPGAQCGSFPSPPGFEAGFGDGYQCSVRYYTIKIGHKGMARYLAANAEIKQNSGPIPSQVTKPVSKPITTLEAPFSLGKRLSLCRENHPAPH